MTKGVINCIVSFMTHLREKFHIPYEIFVLCIIYCLPQNSGGKCVLTENIVKMQEIYGAIEQEELRREILYDQSGTIFLYSALLDTKFDLFLGKTP